MALSRSATSKVDALNARLRYALSALEVMTSNEVLKTKLRDI